MQLILGFYSGIGELVEIVNRVVELDEKKGSQYYIDQIKSNKYPINNENLKSNLIKLSLSKVIPSIYFGIYYLDKETQKIYEKDEDNKFELRFDELDREGWLNLMNLGI